MKLENIKVESSFGHPPKTQACAQNWGEVFSEISVGVTKLKSLTSLHDVVWACPFGVKTPGKKLLPDPSSKPPICLQSDKGSVSQSRQGLEVLSPHRPNWNYFIARHGHPTEVPNVMLLQSIQASQTMRFVFNHITQNSDFCLYCYLETHICLSCFGVLKTPNENLAVSDALREGLHSGRANLNPEPQVPTSQLPLMSLFGVLYVFTQGKDLFSFSLDRFMNP